MSSEPSTSCCGVTSASGLDSKALQFAAELTAIVRSLVPDCAAFVLDASSARESTERVSVRQDPETGISLTVNSEPLINLKVRYLCSLDRAQQYLAVESSEIVVRDGRFPTADQIRLHAASKIY